MSDYRSLERVTAVPWWTPTTTTGVSVIWRMSDSCHQCFSFSGKNLLVTSKAGDGGHSAPSMEDMHRISFDLPYRPLLSGTVSQRVRSSNQGELEGRREKLSLALIGYYCQAQAQVWLSLALFVSYFVTVTLWPEPGANTKFGLPPTYPPTFWAFTFDSCSPPFGSKLSLDSLFNICDSIYTCKGDGRNIEIQEIDPLGLRHSHLLFIMEVN